MFVSFLVALFACGEPAADVSAETTAEAPVADAPTEAKDADKAAAAHYGQPFTLTDTIAAPNLIADLDKHTGKAVRVEGRVADVCQKMGCWLVLTTEDGKTLRVTMKDHGFAVDKGATGGWAVIEGTVVEREISAEESAHLASEAATAAGAPAPGKAYELQATAVEIRRS